MNLRQQLLAATELRSCTPYGTQQRNYSGKCATGTATAAQHKPANPHEIRVWDATGTATGAQHPSCGPATLTQPQARSCATVAHDLDDRVICTACRHLWPGNRCLNHRRADLNDRDLAADFTLLPQRCPGYAPKARAQAPPMHTPAPTPKTETKTDDDRRQTDLQPVQPIFESDNIMIVTDTGGSAFTPCPAGSYLARCVQLIDLGTQASNFEGQEKRARKVLVAWEVLDDECRRDDDQPFVLSKRFTLSLHEKAALRKTLASWRGRDFTPLELRGFDLATVLGKEAFLSVIHTEKDGKTFANIAAVMKPPKGMVGTPATELLVHLDLSAMDWTVYAGLSPRLAEQIALSPEFQALTPPRSVTIPAPAQPPAPPPAAAPPAAAPAGSGFDDMDDDIPF